MADIYNAMRRDMDATLRAAARRSAKIIRPEPDCRTCAYVSVLETHCVNSKHCKEGERYSPMGPLRLYRSKT